MQNRDTNLESPIRLPFNGNGDGDCGLSGREIESSRIDVSSRTPPMQMHPSVLFFPPPLLFYPPRFIVPSLSDRSKYSLFIAREREREGGILGCIRHLPYPRHRRAKMVKRGEKGVEVDVGAGNAHAYDRRREMLVTVWIISNRPLTFSPICNSTRIFRAQPGIESNGYTDARFHSSVTFHSFRVLPCPLLFSSSTTSYSGILIIRKSYPRNGWKVGWAVGKPPLSRIRFTLVVRRFFPGIATTTGVNQNLTFDP